MTSFHVIQDVKISHIYFLNSLVNFHSLYTLKSLFQDKKREEFEALIFFFPRRNTELVIGVINYSLSSNYVISNMWYFPLVFSPLVTYIVTVLIIN